MTKTIVLGEQPPKIPIEFIGVLTDAGDSSEVLSDRPADYPFLELVSRSYGVYRDGEKFDLIFAYYKPEDRGDGVLFLGRWNDGVVK